MVVMTSSSTTLTAEEEVESRPTEDSTPTHSHRRRWSTLIDSGGESLHDRFTVRSLADHEGREHQDVSAVNLDDFFSCSSSDNSYSFYLGGQLSPWGPFGPPLLTEPRQIAPPPLPLPSTTEALGELRRGRSLTRKRDLPPFLTTLDCNGRPRFYHRRMRSEGRLEIASVAVDLPEIVRVRGSEGLRIGTVRVSEEEEEDDQQNHLSSSLTNRTEKKE